MALEFSSDLEIISSSFHHCALGLISNTISCLQLPHLKITFFGNRHSPKIMNQENADDIPALSSQIKG